MSFKDYINEDMYTSIIKNIEKIQKDIEKLENSSKKVYSDVQVGKAFKELHKSASDLKNVFDARKEMMD